MILVELDNINKSFGTQEVIKNFSLQICKGDYISITGPSGKGKTVVVVTHDPEVARCAKTHICL